MFYARQIWGLSKGNYYITVAIIALTFLQFGLSATLTAKAFSLDVLEYLMGKEIEWMAAVCLAATLACNLLITASLCYYLYINKTGFDVTDSFINSLMLYSLTTGFLTSTCALINLVLFVSMPTKIVSYAANFTMAKLYTISVLTMLNHRDKCRLKLSQNVTPQTFHLGPLKFEGNETPNKTNHVTIHMTHETEVRSDFDHMISVTTDDSRSE
ncbi:hypothetical protein BD410DRAFT_51382 [Rickenella mellea]|uniref:DUF6534 domain-containing protein n=1 Tax=Rickenella mellea TaxID=50990 RepID=A0A4R5XHX5_9AGAM|nr:hypothetical protein BD410DRAFT_51382 [Rickenella mellea]